jgi:hypothetical protein
MVLSLTSLSCMSFSPPGQAVVCLLSPTGSRALAQSWPYSPLVQSRFLPWLTGFCISNRFHVHSLLIALMMEAASTSETLVNFYQTIRRYNLEDSHLSSFFLYATFIWYCIQQQSSYSTPWEPQILLRSIHIILYLYSEIKVWPAAP